MTVPRNSWIRSRSPSLIRRWTLTVSPGRSSGIWGLPAASTPLLLSLIRTPWHVFSVQPPPHTLGRRTRSLPRPAGRRPEPAATFVSLRGGRRTAVWIPCQALRPEGLGDSSALAPLGPRNDNRTEASSSTLPRASPRGRTPGRFERSRRAIDPCPPWHRPPGQVCGAPQVRCRWESPMGSLARPALTRIVLLQPRPRQIQRCQRFGVAQFAGSDQCRDLFLPDPLDGDLLVAVGGKGRRGQAGGG